jgi:ribonuclease HII
MLLTRFKDDDKVEIGIDEAGRGSFWGPLMAGAVIIPPESEWTDDITSLVTQIKDSKKISAKKRIVLAEQIKNLFPQWGIGLVDSKDIDDNGIGWANQEAFRRAVENIDDFCVASSRLIIDGALLISKWDGEQEMVDNGDATYLAIAAASIIAKVEHDKWIASYCKHNTECEQHYDLLNSKGYGTKNHRNGIKTYGAHKLHRLIFIRNYLPQRERDTINAKIEKKNDTCLIKF